MKKFLFLVPLLLVVLSIQIADAQTENGCDPNAQWKNHGAYVSCVAKQKPGGQVVSEAAKSDVGKKNADTTPIVTPDVTETPTPTPEPNGEVTPTPTEEITPTPTVEETPTPTPGEELVEIETENNALIRGLIQSLQDLIKSLIDLL